MTAAHRDPRGTSTRRSSLVRRTAMVGALLAAGALAAAPAWAGAHRAWQEATDETPVAEVLSDQLAAAGIPGGAVVVVGPGGTVTPQGVGSIADGEPVTADTAFVIGSTTKSFTALAVMQLVEAGSVELDAPVTRYVPELELADSEPVDEITVRHLLQHTSGLDDLAGGPLLASVEDGTALEAVAELRDAELASAPGQTWRYANANYVLAGLVVERATDQSYPEYLQAQVLEPLGMDDTYVTQSSAVAPGNQYWFGFTAESGPVQRDGVVAAGYVASTARDLGRYLAMYLRGGTAVDGTRVLSSAGVRTLLTPGPTAHLGPWAEGATARYAMGWMVGGPWAEAAVFHPGNSPDSSAMLALFPARNTAAATLVPAGHELPVPGNPSLTDRISRNTLHAVLGEPVPEPTSRWSFYLWFDLVALALLGFGSWTLVRAVRTRRRTTIGRLRRWLRPLPSALAAAVLLALPALTTSGWQGAWVWAPDLALLVATLAALATATSAVRVSAAVRQAPARRTPPTASMTRKASL